jgi:hypothetical protein
MKESRLTVICMTVMTELATRTRSLIQFQKELHWLGRTLAMELCERLKTTTTIVLDFFMTLNPSNKVQENQRERGGSIFMISNQHVFIALVMLTVIFVKNMYYCNPVRLLNTRTVKQRPAEGSISCWHHERSPVTSREAWWKPDLA